MEFFQNESNNIIQAQNLKSLKTRSQSRYKRKNTLMFLALTRFLRNLATNRVQNKSLKTRSQSHQKSIAKNSFYSSFLSWLEFAEIFQQMHEGKSGKSGRLVKPNYSGRFWKKKHTSEQNTV